MILFEKKFSLFYIKSPKSVGLQEGLFSLMPLWIPRIYYQSFFKDFGTQTTLIDASQMKIVPAEKYALLKTICLPASGIANFNLVRYYETYWRD
jgi:hypothetical protein